MAWECLNAVARTCVALVVIIKLVGFHDHYRWDERIGLGVAGGCALLTVPAALIGQDSPFYAWAGAMFAIGVLVYFIGRLRRQIHHARANREQIRRARERIDLRSSKP